MSRVYKAAQADPFSTVKSSLGPKSGSHPDLHYKQGGGFLVATEKKRALTSQEIAQENARREAKFKEVLEKKPKAKAPKQVDEGATVTEFKGGIEYHPPGGVHSNYPETVNYEEGGSYVRVTPEVPQGEKQRIGRHGPFSPTTTFDHQPLKGRPAQVTNPKPPKESDSPPPSPETAHQIMQAMHQDPVETMAQLQSGKPYADIAKAQEKGKAPSKN
ncbi:hypothetical protein [Mycoavidus sp. B2-EB]|uniref:hypothetical protein n=1 Tax=Mycoavidus sp. B2-EB TaxID=2651972 RepID=UPI001E5C7A50|nr:hypothetical protein [Mycoavidus sp. B2-EB]